MMKRKINSLMTMFLTLILMVFTLTEKVFAEQYCMEDAIDAEEVESDSLYSVESFEVDRIAIEEIPAEDCVIENEIISAETVQTMEMLDDEEDAPEPVSIIYNGTMTGYLSAVNTYVLYPTNLNAGEYLQARLTPPNDSEIDYDLLLFDSNLSLIKSSDYVTYMNPAGTLEESIGYIAATEVSLYVCVYSVGGGSTTEAYTLDYSITTNFTDLGEPCENAKEAIPLTLGGAGVTVTGKLNTAIDNDWYSFESLGDPAHQKIRLSFSSDSTTNGHRMEIYRNLVVTPGYYGMQYLGTYSSGELLLPAGTYYLRIVSTNTSSNFIATDIPTYNFSVVPISKVEKLYIVYYYAIGGGEITLGGSQVYRIEQDRTRTISILGTAYYWDENHQMQPAVNAPLVGEIYDSQWAGTGSPHPEWAYVYSSTVTDSTGRYEMVFNLNPACGREEYTAYLTHHYDDMRVTISSAENSAASVEGRFLYVRYMEGP